MLGYERRAGGWRQRGRHRRRAWAAACGVGLAVVLAGCSSNNTPSVAHLGANTDANSGSSGSGSSGSSNSSDSGTAKFEQEALRFSQCMRAHGVPNFSDPKFGESGGQQTVMLGGGSGFNPNSPQFQAAQQACGHFLPKGGGPGGGPAMSPQQQAKLLKFSQCMRAHGISDFPDPGSHGLQLSINNSGSSDLDPQSPQFQAAQNACQKYLPGGHAPRVRVGMHAPAGAGSSVVIGIGGSGGGK